MSALQTEAEVAKANSHNSSSQAALKSAARHLAHSHIQVTRLSVDTQSLAHLDDQKVSLDQAYAFFRQQERGDSQFGQAEEWLLDNYYVISSAIRQVEQDMPGDYYRQLPRLIAGEWHAFPRIYVLAREILTGQVERLEIEIVRQFVAYYQEITPLQMGELWALPTMLRFNIIERLIQSLLPFTKSLNSPIQTATGAASADANQVVPWCVMGLRALDTQDWKSFFEAVSLVDRILAQDPAAVYLEMNFDTRDTYRKVVEQLSRKTYQAEIEVATQAVALARQADTGQGVSAVPTCARHVGFYLVDAGLPQLEKVLSYRPGGLIRLQRWWLDKHPALFYLGSVTVLSLLLYLLPAVYLRQLRASPVQIVVGSLLLIVPLLTIAVSLSSRLMTLVVKPRILPKLAFEGGISADCRSMVVMPTLLNNAAQVKALVRQLELHYLRNQDPNITFALLTDFCDAPQQHMPDDDALIKQISRDVKELNQKHGRSANRGPFYLFHRTRLWNAEEGCWMGWERKRGKLEEFNRLLLGDETTTYTVQIGNLGVLPATRYVITLDSDTILPHSQARRLIGTLAHPLNRTRFHPEKGTVIGGYAVLQPRVEVKPTSANYSIFSQIFSGHNGIDLYSVAVSDMYQDLIGEGIYMGKGIYEVAAFNRCLIERVPENTLLSHDLFEGLQCRAGFVSDVIVYEEFPPSYKAYARRAHRWMRGDWQLLPWLLPWVPHRRDGRTRNELRLIDRWKIFDNLRRSLVRPALMLLLLAGWLWLPGSPLLWTTLAVLTLATDLFSTGIDTLAQRFRGRAGFVSERTLARPLWRWLLELVALPYEAFMACDAIFRVLLRMFITRKRLLEWTTAAQTNWLLGYHQVIQIALSEMLPAAVLPMTLAVILSIYNRISLLSASPLLVAWLIGPIIMSRISHPAMRVELSLSPEQVRRLRGLTRRTWFFFEQFVGPEDHWLAPDHFQENPRGLVAHRTSPTNIGLLLLSTLAAYDMGYLGLPELQVRLKNTLDNLVKLERFRGHFQNWYDTSTLAPLPPRYISTVDSGNLACCLVALRQSCLDVPEISLPRCIRRKGFLDTLAILSEILAQSARAAPERVLALQQCVDSMVAQLESLGDAPQNWSLLLNRFREVEWQQADQELVSLLSTRQIDPAVLHSVRIWADRARYQLFDMQRKLHLMMPWLMFFSETPRLLEAPLADPAVSAAWQKLKDIFPLETIPCKQIPGTCQAAEEQLAKLTGLLQASPADPLHVEETAQWCARFGQSLAEARIEVGKLLDAYADLGLKMESLVREMDFSFLYNHKRGVFHIGYNVDRDARDDNFYDLLASEARLASLIAIAKGDAPETHWLALSRPLTQSRWGSVLLSWSGTMFEYLMPGLLVRQYPDTLLTQSLYNSIECQIDYARQKRVPWGISESGYNRFDAALNYQYRAFGVPGLGFKRGLEEDLVISPYASLLALPFRPGVVMDNIAHLTKLQMLGDYGFYEAVDFTPKRLTMGEKGAIIRSFMIHHQGMIMVSLVNTLLDKPMVHRFHADPQVRSIELLLQERLPASIPAIDLPGEQVAMARPTQPRKMAASWQVPSNTIYPWVHYLSNGRYGVMITKSGAGFSRWRDIDLTRWRTDTTLDDWGTWIYIRDQDSGELWSGSPQPINHPKVQWEVNFSPHRTDFHGKFSNITSDLQITVPPDDDVEIRQLRLTNDSRHPRRLAITSFGELVLGDQNNDRRHPAFNKLFIESKYQPQNHTLIFRRRPREAAEQPLFLAHAVVVEPDASIVVKFESAREQFLKRGGSPRRPGALISGDGGLSGSVGAVLDPIMSLQVYLEIEPHSTVEVAFLTLAGSSSRQLSTLIARYQRPGQVADAFSRAQIQSEQQLHQLNLDSTEISRYQQLLSLLLYPHARLRSPMQILARNRSGQSSLWPFAVSGDFPILLVKLTVDEELGLLRELLQAYRYWRIRGLKIDLVILNEQDVSYDQTLHQKLIELLEHTQTDQWLNQRSGIFVLQSGRLSPADLTLFDSAARVVLRGQSGNLEQIFAQEYKVGAWPPQFVPPRMRRVYEPTPPLPRPSGLLYDNGWGGFDADGREYVIYLQPGEWTPAPWVNVISNSGFGFLVSETGGCFSWAINSGENRLSPWHNDPVRDPSGEALYLRDETTGEIWSPTPQPVPAEEPYLVRHSAGYTIFEHHSHGLKHTLRVFADVAAPVKLVGLRLENTWSQPRVLLVTYYCEWVLGINRDQAQQYLIPEYDSETGALLALQPYQEEFGQGVAFLAACQHPDSLTTDRTEFIGRLGELSNPAALGRVGLTGRVETGTDPCAVLQIFV
ncbi:MAG: hypothetical protein JSV61_13300, partial [Anaerolineales bacterium]